MLNLIYQIMETFPLPTVLINSSLSVINVNSSGLEFMNSSLSDIINKNCKTYFPEIDLCINQESQETETYHIDSKGIEKTLILKYVKNPLDKSLGLIYLIKNSDTNRHIQKSNFSSRKLNFLKRRIHFFETFLNSTSEGIQIFNNRGQLVYLNKFSSDLLKINQNQVKNHFIWQIPFFCSSKEEWIEKMDLLRANKELKFNIKLENDFSVAINYRKIDDDEYFEVTFNDITEILLNKNLVEQKDTQIEIFNQNFSAVFFQFVVNDKNEGYFTYINGNFEQFFNFKIPLNDKSFMAHMIIHPDDLEAFTKAKMDSIESRKMFEFIGRIVSVDKKIAWIKVNSIPVFHDNLIVFNGVVLDITSRKDIEIENKNKREFNDNVLSNIPADVAVFDKNHNYLFINSNGISDEKLRNWLIGKNDFDYCKYRGLDTSKAQIRRNYFNKALETQSKVDWVDEIKKDGKDIYVLRRFYPFVVDGELVYMIGYGIDVTELRVAQETIIKNEKRNELILKSSLDAVILINSEENITFWNPNATMIFGWTKEEVLNKSFFDIVFPESIRDGYKKEIALYNNKSKGSIFNKLIEIYLVNKDNNEFPVELSIVAIGENQGQFTFCIFLKEISSRKEKEREISWQNKMLQNKNKELEQFTYIASHDLQEPLLTLMSSSNLLLEEHTDSLNEEGKLFVQFINKSAMRMRALVSGLMEYARIDKRETIVEVNCKEVIENVLQDIYVNIERNNAVIKLNSLPIIKGYSVYLHLLFQNLLINAIKFKKSNTIPIVSVSCQERELDWLFSVSDNGIGILEKNKDQIFVIFKRLNSQDRYEGYGIGLSHCKKIVELHDGEIWVDSKLGEGSTFFFTISKNIQNAT